MAVIKLSLDGYLRGPIQARRETMQAFHGLRAICTYAARDHACLSPYRSDTIMMVPVWTKPALLGAGAGAIAVAILGFGWGGWMTSSSAAEMSNNETKAGIVAALTPYCVQKSQGDPNAAGVLAEIEDASRFQRRGIVEEAGWATPLGADGPDRALAEACVIALTSDT